MLLKEISFLNSKREILLFILLSLFILTYTILIEYHNYKQLTHFDSAIVYATVIKQYTKTKLSKTGKLKNYQVLKLKADKGYTFYTTKSKTLENIKGKKVMLELWLQDITFYQYMQTFFGYTRFIKIEKKQTLKQKLNNSLAKIHQNSDITSIYQALYTATPLPKELQQIFSTLGISHLLAISGFHLGVLSTLLFFLLKYPYSFFQNRYFPYRSAKVDIFIVVAFLELIYLLFLDIPPSLLRAFTMLLIGFLLYDRGFKVISMQTLTLTIIVILIFAPRLLFSLGFWLSVSGVFYIFLFLIYFKKLNSLWQLLLVPLWVYIMMLPLSLFIFKNFTIYHPISIIWTSLFTLFYPLSIFLHLIGLGTLLDSSLLWLLELAPKQTSQVELNISIFLSFMLLSFMGIFWKKAIWILIPYSFAIFIYAMKTTE